MALGRFLCSPSLTPAKPRPDQAAQHLTRPSLRTKECLTRLAWEIELGFTPTKISSNEIVQVMF